MKSHINQLIDHLKANLDALRIRTEQLGVDTQDGLIEPGGQTNTELGYHAADLHYTALISIERLPAGAVHLFGLLVITWLTENDKVRAKYDLPWPRLEIMDLGEQLVDAMMEIPFVDQFHLGEAADGPITINGKTYDVDAWELLTAEAGSVEGAPV